MIQISERVKKAPRALVSPSELSRLRQEGFPLRLLDVRTAEEFEYEHIPGSYSVPLETLDEHIGELSGAQQPIVLVCREHERAVQAEELLEQSGLIQIHVLEGGIKAWDAAGNPVQQSGEKWSLGQSLRLFAGLAAVMSVVGGILVISWLLWIAVGVGLGLAISAARPSGAWLARMREIPVANAFL